MIRLHEGGVFWHNGKPVEAKTESCRENGTLLTMAAGIMLAHNTSGDIGALSLKFDSLISHDITYVGIIQTARASGLEKFPIPYAMTN